MNYFLYILKTTKNTLYTGIATNPLERFQKHLNGIGAKYTRAFKPEKIVYLREFEDKSDALREEIRIKKKLNRNQKDLLIKDNEQNTSSLIQKLSP